MYEIKKGIPVPPRRANEITMTLKAMEVGDTVFFADKLGGNISPYFIARRPARFVLRTVFENPGRGVHVWRVK